MRDWMVIVQVSRDIELIESVVLLRRCLEMAGYSVVTLREERLCMVAVEGSQDSFSSQKISTCKIVLKWPFTSNTGEETLHVHCSGLLGHRVLWIDSFSQEIVLKWLFVSDTEEEILHIHYSALHGHRALWVCIHTQRTSWNGRSVLRSHRMELFESVEVYLKRWYWNGCSLVILWRWLCIFIVL